MVVMEMNVNTDGGFKTDQLVSYGLKVLLDQTVSVGEAQLQS